MARGDDAELHLRDHTPDLVLLDWMLPGLSGIELCRRLRTRRDTAINAAVAAGASKAAVARVAGISKQAVAKVVRRG